MRLPAVRSTSPKRRAKAPSGTNPGTPPSAFPRVFYLRYHGYSAYFPTWALGRYANLMRGNSKKVQWGM
jgi:squalene cyclase